MKCLRNIIELAKKGELGCEDAIKEAFFSGAGCDLNDELRLLHDEVESLRKELRTKEIEIEELEAKNDVLNFQLKMKNGEAKTNVTEKTVFDICYLIELQCNNGLRDFTTNLIVCTPEDANLDNPCDREQICKKAEDFLKDEFGVDMIDVFDCKIVENLGILMDYDFYYLA